MVGGDTKLEGGQQLRRGRSSEPVSVAENSYRVLCAHESAVVPQWVVPLQDSRHERE